jgi:hypothetical protein
VEVTLTRLAFDPRAVPERGQSLGNTPGLRIRNHPCSLFDSAELCYVQEGGQERFTTFQMSRCGVRSLARDLYSDAR